MDQHKYTTEGADTAHQIAARLEEDRSAFADALGALRDRFSLDTLMSDGTALLRQNAGPYTQVIDRAVRANPLALGVAAVGVAWLILGRRMDDKDEPALAGTAFDAVSRWEDEGGPVAPVAPVDTLWIDEVDGLRARAAGLLARIDDAARKGLAPAADLVRSRADVMAALARDVARVMAQGLDGVADSAREQAIAARDALYAARQKAGEIAAAPVRNNPALTGALLAAAGAALGAALPQTRVEHRVIGPVRDRVADAAKAMLTDERQRLAGVVQRLSHDLASDITASEAHAATQGPGRRPH